MESKISATVKSVVDGITKSQTTPKAFRECCICGKTIELEANSPKRMELDVKCHSCEQNYIEVNNTIAELAKRERISSIMSNIPTAFHHTERDKLPDPLKMDMAMKWKFGQKGLLLYGPTGCGKSRVAWEIVKREALSGRTVKSINSFEIAKYPAMIMNDSSRLEQYTEGVVNVDLLLLDDVFKAKPTERVEELLFSIIDERGQWERPCIVTLNDTGETLESRLSTDRGPAMIRRLRDYCQAIQF